MSGACPFVSGGHDFPSRARTIITMAKPHNLGNPSTFDLMIIFKLPSSIEMTTPPQRSEHIIISKPEHIVKLVTRTK